MPIARADGHIDPGGREASGDKPEAGEDESAEMTGGGGGGGTTIFSSLTNAAGGGLGGVCCGASTTGATLARFTAAERGDARSSFTGR